MSINENPVGKCYFTYPFDHFEDSTDPHGETWTQTDLIVMDILSGTEIRFNELMPSGAVVGDNLIFENLTAQQIRGWGLTEFIAQNTDVSLLSGIKLVVSGGGLWGSTVNVLDGVTIDGIDISGHGLQLDTHLIDFNNPHQVTVDQVSGIPTAGGVLSGDLAVNSGISIDGVDVSEMKRMVDGSVIPDSDHYHRATRRTRHIKQIFVPEYEGVVFSGTDYTVFSSDYDGEQNHYTFSGTDVEHNSAIFIKGKLDDELKNINSIGAAVRGLDLDVAQVDLVIYDSDGNTANMVGGKNIQGADSVMSGWTMESASGIHGNFIAGGDVTIAAYMETFSGSEVNIGPICIDYDRTGIQEEETLANDLLLYLRLNEADPVSTYPDLSGNGNNGTPTGVTVSDNGKFGRSVSFTIVGASKIECGNAAIVNNLSIKCVSAWIKPEPYGPFAYHIVQKYSGSLGWRFCALPTNPYSLANSRLVFVEYFTGSNASFGTPLLSLPSSVFSHVIAMYDNSDILNLPIFYINGIQQDVQIFSAPTGTSTDDSSFDLTVGGESLETVNGLLSEVQLYDRFLTDAEIQKLYAGGFGRQIDV